MKLNIKDPPLCQFCKAILIDGHGQFVKCCEEQIQRKAEQKKRGHRLIKFKIGETKWEIIHYVGLNYFCVYKNDKLAKDLYMNNEFCTEGGAQLAILKTYQI